MPERLIGIIDNEQTNGEAAHILSFLPKKVLESWCCHTWFHHNHHCKVENQRNVITLLFFYQYSYLDVTNEVAVSSLTK